MRFRKKHQKTSVFSLQTNHKKHPECKFEAQLVSFFEANF